MPGSSAETERLSGTGNTEVSECTDDCRVSAWMLGDQGYGFDYVQTPIFLDVLSRHSADWGVGKGLADMWLMGYTPLTAGMES